MNINIKIMNIIIIITSVIENRTFAACITFIYLSHSVLSLLIEIFSVIFFYMY